uniref:Uncharacterized protein n=1 Tax=Helianthus annuus TaxID=4232 RepID=A0A251U0N6_HELAN
MVIMFRNVTPVSGHGSRFDSDVVFGSSFGSTGFSYVRFGSSGSDLTALGSVNDGQRVSWVRVSWSTFKEGQVDRISGSVGSDLVFESTESTRSNLVNSASQLGQPG